MPILFLKKYFSAIVMLLDVFSFAESSNMQLSLIGGRYRWVDTSPTSVVAGA
jgi:hypothetical protein